MENKNNLYDVIGGIVYKTLQSQKSIDSRLDLSSIRSSLHDPITIDPMTMLSVGYKPQYTFQTTPEQSFSYIPQSYVRDYSEIVPLTFGKLGSAPVRTGTVSTIHQTSFTLPGEQDVSSNQQAWNEVWAQYGNLTGIKDQTSYLYLLGQIMHESSNFKHMEEIASGEAYEGRRDLGNIYQGDGVKYKGRGPIQVTGRANYENVYRNFFVPNGLGEYDIVNNPELASDPRIGSLLSLGWLLTTTNGKKAISESNNHNITALTKAINGGQNGLAHRTKITNTLLQQYGENIT